MKTAIKLFILVLVLSSAIFAQKEETVKVTPLTMPPDAAAGGEIAGNIKGRAKNSSALGGKQSGRVFSRHAVRDV